MTDYHFAIRCLTCETTLRLSDEDLGTKRKCPKCDSVLQVPEQVRAHEQAAAEEAKHEFSFLCKLCGTRLYGRPSQIGQAIECPDCESVNVVPAPPKPVKKQIPADLGDDYGLAPLEQRPPSSTVADVSDSDEEASQTAEPPPIRFNCRYCNTLLYAARDRIGQLITCPDCDGRVTVPDRPIPKPKRKINLEHAPDIGVSPAADRPQESSNAESLMSSAMDHVIEKEKERPDPPKYPFGLGVYAFPFNPIVAALAVFLFCMFSATNYFMQVGIESTGLGMVVGLIVWLMGIFSLVASGILLSFVATNIVTWAAMGYQKIVEWPNFDILDWLRRSLFLFNAFAISSAPGACIAYVISGGLWRAIFPLTTTFILFPIVLLSMVSEESPFVPISRFILASLGRVASSWIKFYLHAIALVALIGIPLVGVAFGGPGWSYATVGVFVYAALVYFRVMGRLAHVIDEALAGYDEGDAKDEEAEAILQEDHEGHGVEPPPIADSHS